MTEMTAHKMPRYKCHQEVYALRIARVELRDNPHSDDPKQEFGSMLGQLWLQPADEGYAPFQPSPEWRSKWQRVADAGGYYVVYDDGYTSYSPAEAFEDGYKRTPQKYDDVLLPFLSIMRRELHANSRKGDRPGWLSMDANTALLEVYWHAAKLSAAVKNKNVAAIQEHSADVANMAMMVLDVCGGLETSFQTPLKVTLTNVNGGEQWTAISNYSPRIVVGQKDPQEAVRLALSDAKRDDTYTHWDAA